jgi:hypothetical protein
VIPPSVLPFSKQILIHGKVRRGAVHDLDLAMMRVAHLAVYCYGRLGSGERKYESPVGSSGEGGCPSSGRGSGQACCVFDKRDVRQWTKLLTCFRIEVRGNGAHWFACQVMHPWLTKLPPCTALYKNGKNAHKCACNFACNFVGVRDFPAKSTRCMKIAKTDS